MQKSSFYLLTDTHLVSKRSWVEGKSITMRERGDQIALKLSPEILDTFIEKIIADTETDTVVFTGDNVNSGDLASHEDFKKRLERLTEAGKRVFVTTATHDYCSPNGEDECFQHGAVRYTENGTEPTPFMLRKELFDYYFDYGPKQAISVHRESESYVVRIGDGVRLVMINDNGNGRSHCGLFEDGVEWLKEQIKSAKEAGDFVLLAVHHPVIPPWPVFAHMVEYEMYGGYKELSKLMCDEGVRVIFTGHVHEQSIRRFTDDKGDYFFDVATVAAVNAAGKMRKVTVDPDEGVCFVESVGFETISGVDTGDESAYEYLYHLNLPGRAELLLPLALTDYDAFLKESEGSLPVDKLKAHPKMIRFAIKKLSGMRLKRVAKLGKVWKKLTDEEKSYAEKTKLINVVYVILRHIYPGNAPYTPETVEYKSLMGLAERLDRLVKRFKIKKVIDMLPLGSTIAGAAEDFLYNNRTGDDDTICINLK